MLTYLHSSSESNLQSFSSLLNHFLFPLHFLFAYIYSVHAQHINSIGWCLYTSYADFFQCFRHPDQEFRLSHFLPNTVMVGLWDQHLYYTYTQTGKWYTCGITKKSPFCRSDVGIRMVCCGSDFVMRAGKLMANVSHQKRD